MKSLNGIFLFHSVLPIKRAIWGVSLWTGLCLALFSGCSPKETSDDSSAKKPGILVTVEPIVDFAQTLAGDSFEVVTLIPPGEEPETFSPSPAQIRSFSRCQLFFRVGLPPEAPLSPRLKETAPNLILVDLYTPPTEGEELDPHIWMSPALMKRAVTEMAQTLTEIRPEEANAINQRRDALLSRLSDLEKEISDALQGLPTRTIYVFHPAYGHFCQQFGLEQRAMEKEGSTPTPKEMADWIRAVRDHKIRLLIAQPEFGEDQIRSVARDAGTDVEVHSPLQSDYFENLRTLTALIQKANSNEAPPTE